MYVFPRMRGEGLVYVLFITVALPRVATHYTTLLDAFRERMLFCNESDEIGLLTCDGI